MGLGFFGLTSKNAPQIRINLFRQLHSLIFHSKGAYDYYTIYSMPIWLRKFTFSEIDKFYKDEQDAYSKSQSGDGQSNVIDSDGKVNAPAFLQDSKSFKGKTGYK